MSSSKPTAQAGAVKRGAPRRRSAQPRRAKAEKFLSERQAISAVIGYLKLHPQTRGLTLSLRGEKVEVKPLPRKKTRTLEIAPPGFFADMYTAEEIAAENRLAAQSVVFDPSDLPE